MSRSLWDRLFKAKPTPLPARLVARGHLLDAAQQSVEKLAGTAERAHQTIEQMMPHYRIGILTVSWAALEIGLDYANFLVLNIVPGADKIGTELPRALDRKLDFFERAHQELPPLSEYRASAENIVRTIRRLKDHRHDIVHGYARGLLKEKDVNIDRLMLEGANIRQLSRRYTEKRLWTLIEEFGQLTSDTLDHAQLLRAALGLPDGDDDPRGALVE